MPQLSTQVKRFLEKDIAVVALAGNDHMRSDDMDKLTYFLADNNFSLVNAGASNNQVKFVKYFQDSQTFQNYQALHFVKIRCFADDPKSVRVTFLAPMTYPELQ